MTAPTPADEIRAALALLLDGRPMPPRPDLSTPYPDLDAALPHVLADALSMAALDPAWIQRAETGQQALIEARRILAASAHPDHATGTDGPVPPAVRPQDATGGVGEGPAATEAPSGPHGAAQRLDGHLYTDRTGIDWIHPGDRAACDLPECAPGETIACTCLCPPSTHTGPGGHCAAPECHDEPCTPMAEWQAEQENTAADDLSYRATEALTGILTEYDERLCRAYRDLHKARGGNTAAPGTEAVPQPPSDLPTEEVTPDPGTALFDRLRAMFARPLPWPPRIPCSCGQTTRLLLVEPSGAHWHDGGPDPAPPTPGDGLREEIAAALTAWTAQAAPRGARLPESVAKNSRARAHAVMAVVQPRLDAAHRRAEQAEAALARLHEGEEPHPDEYAEATPAQWIWRWNRATPERRLEVAASVIEKSGRADRCFLMNHEKRLADAQAAPDAARRVRSECDAIEAESYGQHGDHHDGHREAVARIRAALDGTDTPTETR